jgi:hypothetical protein
MRRRLLNLLTVLSVLVCVAAVALWVRSYWRYDLGSVAIGYEEVGYHSLRGHLMGFWSSHIGQRPESGRNTFRCTPGEWRWGSLLEFHGDWWAVYDQPPHVTRISVSFPHWTLAAVAAVPPAAAVIRRRRRRKRLLHGLCPSCGYDLRASPGCCPECGSRRAA